MTERVIATYKYNTPRPKRYRVEALGRAGWGFVSEFRFKWQATHEARTWAQVGLLASEYRVVDTRADPPRYYPLRYVEPYDYPLDDVGSER